MTTVRKFMERHYLHFNSREVVAAAKAYEKHIESGGKMMVTLAGAMSTARIGRILARMIREDKVHQIYSQMQVGQSKFGMLTLNQSLISLVQKRLISVDEALGRCSELDEFRTMLINAGIQVNAGADKGPAAREKAAGKPS